MWQYVIVFLFVLSLVSAISIVSYRNGILNCEAKNKTAVAAAVAKGSEESKKAKDNAARVGSDRIDVLLDRAGWLRKDD